jgi:hypothetical protein
VISGFDGGIDPMDMLSHPRFSRKNIEIKFFGGRALLSQEPRKPAPLSAAHLCVPKTLSRIDWEGNRLTSAHNDRAVMFYPGRRGLAIQVEEPA